MHSERTHLVSIVALILMLERRAGKPARMTLGRRVGWQRNATRFASWRVRVLSEGGGARNPCSARRESWLRYRSLGQ